MKHRVALFTALILATFTLAGCSPYVLRGKVIEGTDAGVYVVTQTHPRIEAIGLPDTSIQLTLDPRSLGRKNLGSFNTDPLGRFNITIDQPGAGLLEDEYQLVIRRPGYTHVEQIITLPSSDQFLLIVMQRGIDTYQAPQDPLQDVQEYLNR